MTTYRFIVEGSETDPEKTIKPGKYRPDELIRQVREMFFELIPTIRRLNELVKHGGFAGLRIQRLDASGQVEEQTPLQFNWVTMSPTAKETLIQAMLDDMGMSPGESITPFHTYTDRDDATRGRLLPFHVRTA